ncbi:hypothetical protein CJ010_00795 [Azoarcus sp. DD4]|uniref:phage major capsid protein n=1 Tax=Azoarcus sp. DD4 TaxID=2027405 RepID=UPI00112D197E|nr:hypothetical protein [Azoarcus sp. DD4]QDF95190.1 hypothetical protein CJ010_00795 [Azoarcus sp. DD4]
MKIIPAAGIVGARMIEAASTEVLQVVDLVRKAVGTALGKDWVQVQAVYPDRLVIAENGRLYAYPYTLTDDNQVQLSPRQEVVQTHTPVRLVEAARGAAESGDASGDAVFIESVGEPETGIWTIRVIKAGESGNGNYYPDDVLRNAVRLIEGARVFEKSDAEHIAAGKGGAVPGKSFRNLIGALKNARFVEGTDTDTGEVHADLHLIQPDGDVAVRVREAHARGLSNLFGFSIDADAKAKVVTRGGRKVRQATEFTKVHSVDLIVEPGAGGALLRITEAQASQEDEDMALRQRMIEAIQAHNPNFDGATATDEQIETAYQAAITASARVTEAQGAGAAALTEVRLVECRLVAREVIASAKLPQPAKDKLLERFVEAKEVFTREDVQKAIDGERAYLARFTESGKPALNFDDVIQVEDRSVKINEMLDNFFAGENGVHSFKECYIETTGDRRVTGDLRDVDLSRLRESLGARFVESLTSASWANTLGDSITRRMLAEYADMTELQAWRRIASAVPVNDFRTQERVRIGGYGNLPAVAQSGAYTALTSPSDEKATYAVTKRGGTEDITLEMVRNDDVGSIRRIPTELALAAGNTLYEFVFDFIRTNPTIYDTVALFHATHGNLGAAALDATSFAAARLAMIKQVRAGSSKRLNIGPATVLVPFELQEAAYNLFVRNQNLDKTFVQTINPEVIGVPYWTDANDWAAVADPRRIPTIEIGFLDGREEPELFVQDMPNVGSMFSNDKITYKIRHIYSGAVMDYRGFYKAVVA